MGSSRYLMVSSTSAFRPLGMQCGQMTSSKVSERQDLVQASEDYSLTLPDDFSE